MRIHAEVSNTWNTMISQPTVQAHSRPKGVMVQIGHRSLNVYFAPCASLYMAAYAYHAYTAKRPPRRTAHSKREPANADQWSLVRRRSSVAHASTAANAIKLIPAVTLMAIASEKKNTAQAQCFRFRSNA